MKKTALKEKVNIEFPFGSCSVSSLWNYISTTNGLSEWFANNVKREEKIWTFFWGKSSQQQAIQLVAHTDLSVKFRWKEDPDDYFFEMKILVDDITKHVSLEITDFSDIEDIEDQKLLWTTQVEGLMRNLGYN